MKEVLIIFLYGMFFYSCAVAQSNQPGSGRQVSGIVLDTSENAIMGAIVVLTTAADSVKQITDENGIFVFENIRSGEFTISVRSIGFKTLNKRFLYSEGNSKTVLDAIILNENSLELDAVVINGTPSITYKDDTVEYRAADYQVKPNATVDELLKKMEGVEVGEGGTLTYQGVEVQRARINGKDYAGGDVANAIQNLPAEVFERAQFLDDFGNEAARTGIKEGDPVRVINLVTKRDRSVGNQGRFTTSIGQNERYGVTLQGSRFNGNKQITTNLNFNNTIAGVADQATSIGGAGLISGGINKKYGLSFGFRDQISSNLNINSSLVSNWAGYDVFTSSTSEQLSTLGSSFVTTQSRSDVKSSNHTLNFDLEFELDSANFLRFTPSLTYNSFQTSAFADQSTRSSYQSRQDIKNTTIGSKSPTFKGELIYQHLFSERSKSISLNVGVNNDRLQSTTDLDALIRFYDDRNVPLPDSFIVRLQDRENLRATSTVSLTFSNPIRKGSTTGLRFNINLKKNAYQNKRLTDNVDPLGNKSRVDSLSNQFDYFFTNAKFSALYDLKGNRYNGSLGVTLAPSLLKGASQNSSTLVERRSFNFLPIANFQYSFSRQQAINLRYNGSLQEPAFFQIQPVRDESDPNNPVIGNPNLQVAFNHNINLRYNNFIANRNINFYANLNRGINRKRVTTNVVEYRIPGVGDSVVVRETHFVNLDGANDFTLNYGLSKGFLQRRYRLDFSGQLRYNRTMFMSNNVVNQSDIWNVNYRVGLQINPNNWLELNPNVSYFTTRANYFLMSSRDNSTRTMSLIGDGKIYLSTRNLVSFSARKNFIKGIAINATKNPLVMNFSIERQFFKRNNGSFSFHAFDILKQNNFMTRNFDPDTGSSTDIKTNTLSRYFMITFKWSPQKWTGAPSRGGKPLIRRGDGSFIE